VTAYAGLAHCDLTRRRHSRGGHSPTDSGAGSFVGLSAGHYSDVVSSKSESTTADEPRACSIADALSVVGDRWSCLGLREVDLGVNRFSEIRANTGAPREMLTARLRKLEDEGVLRRERYSERPPRDEYQLTEKGRALRPVLRELRRWGRAWVSDPSAAENGQRPSATRRTRR
jgi:DNA-binding HxlR family transcriptional regulator